MCDADTDLGGALGLERGVVRLVPYNPAWPGLFEREAKLLRGAAGYRVGRIEHIGATSIADMAAKPILDWMAEVGSQAEGVALAPVIETLGYEFRPDEDIPGRLYFRKRLADLRCTHHFSLTEKGSEFWRRQVLFRDYLRSHAGARREYIELKGRLMSQFQFDRPSYIDGKTGFVDKVLALAGLE